jgi:phosphate transport system substrate-binding protein
MSIDYKSLPSATLNASGSSFQLPFQEVMISAFGQKTSKVTINYAGGGSGKGKTDLVNGVVDYAGTDSLLSDANKASAKNGDILYFPIAAAPITVSFNVKGVSNLQLSPTTIAKIFQTQIKTWNDAAIAADNPGVNLPNTQITVVHRSDGSGTTNNFTGFLTKAAPGVWTLGRGDTVNWDSSTQAGNGNQGVAQIVSGTDGAIGYVDYADALASKLTFAKVKNHNGIYQAPSLDGVSAALNATTLNSDLTYDPLDAVGDSVYPIATPTWMIVYKNQSNKATGQAIQAYLNFILTDGQKMAKDANYAPLPETYRENAITHLTTLNILSS